MQIKLEQIRPAYFYVALFLLPFLLYWQIGFMQYVMKWDMLDQFFPYRYFISESLSKSVLPAWNPYQHLGWPFHADPQSGFWYPFTWLFSVFGYQTTMMHLDFMMHVGIAGAGFFLFMRGLKISLPIAFIFALSYQASGVFVNNAQHLTWIIAMAWLPFVLHYYLQMSENLKLRPALFGAICMFFMVTGGYPVFFVILNYFFLGLFLYFSISLLIKKSYAKFWRLASLHVVLYGVFIVLASGYLVSVYAVMPEISRGEGMLPEEAMEGALELKALVSLLTPFAVTVNDSFFQTDLSMLNVYMGLFPLMMFAAGSFLLKNKYVRVFLIFGVICFFASLGDKTPVRELLFDLLPMMDTFRFPAIFRPFFLLSFLAIGGIAAQQILSGDKKCLRYFMYSFAVLFLLLLGLHLYVLPRADYFVKMPDLFNVANYFQFLESSDIYRRISIQSLTQLMLTGLFLILLFRFSRLKYAFTLLLFLVVTDLFLSVQFNLPATAVADVPKSRFQQSLSTFPKGFPEPELTPITENSVYYPQLYPSWHNQNIFSKKPSHAGFNSFRLNAFEELYASGELEKLIKNPVVFFSPDTISAQIRIKKFKPGKIHLEVRNDQAASLVVAQIAYKGWQVSINNDNFEKSDNAMHLLSVDVPEGEHLIKFEYKPAYIRPLIILSFVSTLVLVFFLFFSKQKPLK